MLTHPRQLTRIVAPCLLALAAGCKGDIGGGQEPVPGPPDVEAKTVPTDLATRETVATCSALAAGERLLSVSPEGHAWVAADIEGGVRVRVLDAFFGSMDENAKDLMVGDLAQAQAWSSVDAAMLTESSLYSIEDLSRIELALPGGFESAGSLCGDPNAGGVLVSEGNVFEQRGESWWSWAPGDGSGPASVLRYDGECHTLGDVMWLASESGVLFRVEPTQYSRPIQFDRPIALAATNGLLAVLDKKQLWLGPDSWQPWVFADALPSVLSASGGMLWTMSGDALLRYDGSEWQRFAHEMDEPVVAVGAHAGGVWLAGESAICHQMPGQSLRVEGVRPNLRSTELEYDVRVRASDGDDSLVADVDGEAFELSVDDTGEWLTGRARLDSVGWHTISFQAASTTREIMVKRTPEVERSWKVDIEPIYAANCATGECHRAGGESPPDISSYELWISRAAEIRAQVVDGKAMPPAANVGPDWGEDEIETIDEWLEGGMLP